MRESNLNLITFVPPKTLSMTLVDQEWAVIINTSAGKKKASKHKDQIFQLLDRYRISYKAHSTERVGHAIELVQQRIAQGQRKFIGIGGDATMNEIVNGIFIQKTVPTQEIVMGFIPVGSGND